MTASSTRRDLGPRRAARAAGLAAIVAVVVNLVIFGIGKALDVDFVAVPTGDGGDHGRPAAVALLTVVPLIVGGLLLAALGRRGAGAWNVLAWVGLALGVVSVVAPLDAAVETSTGVALALMHVATGVTWFLVVRREAATP